MEGFFRTNPNLQVSSVITNRTGAGPTYVTDGLTLYLDAGLTSSYPGSGSTWTDLAQGLTFSSNGTQTPFGTVSGVPSFTFNNSGYWTYSTTPSLVDMGGPTTLILWVYNTGLAARKTVFEKAGTSYQSYEQEIAVTWETSNQWTYYSRYNAYDYGNFTTTPLNQWSMNAIKMTTAKTTGVSRQGFRSLNGAAWTSDYVARSTTAVLAAGQIRIGTGYAGTMTNSSISIVMVYNKELSNDEILQNYNAFKQRHGL
jgi:hypothetical protein